MAYFHDGGGYSGLDGYACGPNCPCNACRQRFAGLSEYYYEGEGRDQPRKGGAVAGFGENPGAAAAGARSVAPAARTFKVVAKSFIAPIGGNAGSPYCGSVLNPGPALKLRALAAATDAAYSENPTTDARDRRYRLYSSRTFTVTCNGPRIVSVVPTPIDTDVGLECIPRTSRCLTPPPITLSRVTASQTSPTTYEFSWTAKGRPNLGAEPAFQLVCPRTSVYIWHTVSGRIECANGEPRIDVRFSGSQFPSHRLFINGVVRSPQIPQGPFSNLWRAAGIADPTLVR
jgi:hypothetical protein